MAAPPAIAKVVASGTTPDGQLRATLMLSPSGKLSATQLSQWPSLMLAAMLARCWQVQLRVAVVWVAPGGPDCPTTYQQAIHLAEAEPPVAATAVWAKQAWNDREAPTWLDTLWQRGFRVATRLAGPKDAIWESLSHSLERSNGGGALKAGTLGRLKSSAPIQPPKIEAGRSSEPVEKSVPDGASGITINAVVPSRQSDLAFLLESERALELCATTQWAHGDILSCFAEEIACAEKAREPRETDKLGGTHTSEDLISLWNDTSERFKVARNSVEDRYKLICGSSVVVPEAAHAPWAIDPNSVGGRDRLDIVGALPGPINSHVAANQPEDSSNSAEHKDFLKAQALDEKIASQRFYAVQGSPALSRLFGLTFDLHIERRALEGAIPAKDRPPVGSDLTAYLLIAVDDTDLPSPDDVPKVWTIAKYRRAPRHFLPASRFELGMHPGEEPHPDLSQFDGVLVLGQQIKTSQAKVSRFLLTSLDVPAATEAAIDRRRRGAAKAPDPVMVPDKRVLVSLARRPIEWARKTLATAGLVLLDRGRLEQSVSQFAARTVHERAKQPDAIVLDANDLTIGYRVDVAVRLKSRATVRTVAQAPVSMKWHTLMARRIEHGTSGPFAVNVRKTTAALMASGAGEETPEWRETLDDAVLSLPVRMVVTSNDKVNPQADAFVEEMVAIWTGEPMAAHCAGSQEAKVTTMDIGAGERVTLPTRSSNPRRCPPPLRFGWPYRFGVRAVYAGGISLPLSEAKSRYDAIGIDSIKGRLTLPPYPADDAQSVRRFLRHERVDAPFLLMHADIALRANGEMGFERGSHAVLRSADDFAYRRRGAPIKTQRIFVPPSVDTHFAALHGVFDRVREKSPPQGLPNVRFDAARGGFPFVTAKTIEGINGESFDSPRRISTDKNLQGDIVYVEGGAHRPIPYYPDPAVSAYAVGVRYTGTDTYLHGKAFTVGVYANGAAYPNCQPLVLRIERNLSKPRRDARPRLDEVLSRSRGGAPRPSVTQGVEVSVMLAPGDDFEIDVWCIPSEKQLAKLFAVVESIGVLALARSRTRPGLKDLPAAEALLKALEQLLPTPLCDTIEKCIDEYGGWFNPSDKDVKWGDDGVGGLIAPGHHVLLAIAKALHDTLESRPLDEIAAVQTLRATHATLRPLAMPQFEPFGAPRALRACRNFDEQTSQGAGATPADAGSAAAATSAALAVPTVLASAAPSTGSPLTTQANFRAASTITTVPHEYHLMGDLRIDLATTGAFELRARTAFPTSATFDDRYRGRSARDRRIGAWPNQGRDLTTEEVFGFCVEPDGTVTLPRSEITLLRVEDLPAPVPGRPEAEADGRWPLRLENLTAGETTTSLGTVKARHIFPDRKARRLDIRVLARARHETLMRTASKEAHNGRWLRSSKDPVAPLDDKSPTVSVWLPSDVRPAEPIAHTPIPAFVWRPTAGDSKSRVALVRIPLGRGWFSSGEEERLGIVVWPPNLFELAPQDLASDQVGIDGYQPRQMKLPDFMDDDLGPAGRFITRWGSDPTHPPAELPPSTPLRTFVDPSAFRDLWPDTRLGFEASIAKHVDMPVRTGASTAADLDKVGAQATMKVSLVTYAPRFDIETEQWYVDAAIEHPYEAQPFLRLGLVRYQAHATTDRQVSFAVTQWVQLLPRRDVHVATTSTSAGKHKTVEVTVEGLAMPTEISQAAGTGIRTAMKMRLVREYTSDAGIRCRQVVLQTAEMKQTVEQIGSGFEFRGQRTTWTESFELHDANATLDRSQGATYFVYVEEREDYLPATYENEPVTAAVAQGRADDASLARIEAGPRFSACVAL